MELSIYFVKQVALTAPNGYTTTTPQYGMRRIEIDEEYYDYEGLMVVVYNPTSNGGSGGVISFDIEIVNESSKEQSVPDCSNFTLEVGGEEGEISISSTLSEYEGCRLEPEEWYDGIIAFEIPRNVTSDDVAVIWDSDRETVPERVRWGS